MNEPGATVAALGEPAVRSSRTSRHQCENRMKPLKQRSLLPIGPSLCLSLILSSTTALYGASVATQIPLNSFQLNGSAHLTGANSITLTNEYYQAASAFVPTPFPFPAGASFLACFYYEAQTPEPDIPADGLAFVVENLGPDSPAYLGLSGSGMGFFTLSYYPAIAVTLDYFPNAITGSPAGTIAVATTEGVDLVQTVPNLPVLPGAGLLRGVWIEYNDTTQRLNVYYGSTTFQPGMPTLSTVLPTGLSTMLGGQVYFGITAGTGANYSIQQLKYFSVAVSNAQGLETPSVRPAQPDFATPVDQITRRLRPLGK